MAAVERGNSWRALKNRVVVFVVFRDVSDSAAEGDGGGDRENLIKLRRDIGKMNHYGREHSRAGRCHLGMILYDTGHSKHLIGILTGLYPL